MVKVALSAPASLLRGAWKAPAIIESKTFFGGRPATALSSSDAQNCAFNEADADLQFFILLCVFKHLFCCQYRVVIAYGNPYRALERVFRSRYRGSLGSNFRKGVLDDFVLKFPFPEKASQV